MPLATAEDWPKFTSAPLPENAATLLAAASGLVVDYCGWPIARGTVTGLILDADGSHLLQLPTLYLRSVTSVLVDDVAVTDYRVSAKGLLDRRPGRWPEGFSRVTVTYDHGYDPVPEAVRAVVVGMALQSSTSRPGIRSQTVGAITQTYTDGAGGSALSEFDRAALGPYRISR